MYSIFKTVFLLLLFNTVYSVDFISVGILSDGSGIPDTLRSYIKQKLVRQLNSPAGLNISAHVMRDIDGSPQDYLQLFNRDSSKFDYYVLLHLNRRQNNIIAEMEILQIFDSRIKSVSKNDIETLSMDFILSSEGKNILDKNIIENIKSRVLTILKKKIRVALVQLVLDSGDSGENKDLEKMLSGILATGLSASAHLKLIEIPSKMIREKKLNKDSLFISTGNRLRSNYVISGSFSILNAQIRVDIRCYSVESGGILGMAGTNITRIELSQITEKILELSAELRYMIERDYVPRKEAFAFTALPPSPNTSENRSLLLAAIKTLSRKLKSMETFKVKEDFDLLEDYINKKTDRWTMFSQLNADKLIAVDMDRDQRDKIILDIEIFDANDPNDIPNFSMNSQLADVNGTLNKIITRILDLTNVDSPDDSSYLQIEIEDNIRPFGLQFGVGASIRRDDNLYLGTGGGGVLTIGTLWYPFRSTHWYLEPLVLQFDLFASKQGKTVIGGNILLGGIKYDFYPYHATSIYLGSNFGYFGVLRSGGDDESFDAALGLGITAGMRQELSGRLAINYEIKYLLAFKAIDSQTVGGERFEGGKPGGAQFSAGLSYLF